MDIVRCATTHKLIRFKLPTLARLPCECRHVILSMDVEQFRKAGYAAIDAICDYHSTLSSRDVVPSVAPGYMRAALPTAAPEHGEEWATIAKDYEELVVPGLTHWQHEKFFAYFPTSGNFESILGELYAASTSNPGFNVRPF